jgi:hypothetical protein
MIEYSPEGQVDQAPKSLGFRIIRILRVTSVVDENGVILQLEASGVYL